MLRFEDQRIQEFDVTDKKFKFPIPVISVSPKTVDESSVVFIFNGGLGASNSLVKYMNYPIYDNHWLVSYEKGKHGNNKNKLSQYKKPCQTELDVVVEWVRKQYPNRKIYLLGESWGSQINMLYYGKHMDKIAGMVNWNAPFDVRDVEKKSFGKLFRLAIKHIATILFNVTCKLPDVQVTHTSVTRDPLLARLLSMNMEVKNNSKGTLNVWRHMSAAYRWLKKHGKDPKYNFLYVQSQEDILANPRKIARLAKKYCDKDHLCLFKTGYHILSFEPKEANDLYNTILSFIKK